MRQIPFCLQSGSDLRSLCSRENLQSPVSDRFLYKSPKVTFDFQKFPDYNKVSFEDIVRFFVIGDSRNEYTET